MNKNVTAMIVSGVVVFIIIAGIRAIRKNNDELIKIESKMPFLIQTVKEIRDRVDKLEKR